jgi:hypothetical protein
VTRRRKQENKPVRWHRKSPGDQEQETEAARKMNQGRGLLREREKSRATTVRVTKSKQRKKNFKQDPNLDWMGSVSTNLDPKQLRNKMLQTRSSIREKNKQHQQDAKTTFSLKFKLRL